MSKAIHHQTFVVVDLETTGGSITFDQIIEIALLRIRNGVIQDRFETLVRPNVPIPPFVARLTGITNAMVKDSPQLSTVLPTIRGWTQGANLIAHHISFDHGFLTEAFRRAGVAEATNWAAKHKLCTLRLARRLLRGLHSYKLDSLCAHLGLPSVQRHRAGPDAEATATLWGHLLRIARSEYAVKSLAALVQLQDQTITPKRRTKGSVDDSQVASLPSGPGVYLLKDKKGDILYIGKAVHVRQRVRQHLRPSGTAQSPSQPRLRKCLPFITDVQGLETSSELEALLLESKLVKQYQPMANRRLRDYQDYSFVKLDRQEPYPRLIATREQPQQSDDITYFGPFRRPRRAAQALLFLSERLGLRQCAGDLTPGSQPPCHLLAVRKCLGPCTGAVSQEAYAAAVREAEKILQNEDDSFLQYAIKRRDELSGELRFEEAATFRDGIDNTQYLIESERKLRSLGARNQVVVMPEANPSQTLVRLFWIRAGHLVHELCVQLPVSSKMIQHTLRTVYGEGESGYKKDSPSKEKTRASVGREEVDAMLILDAWLAHYSDKIKKIPVSLADPQAALPILLAELEGLAKTA